MLAMLHFRVSIEDQISVACERAPLGMGDKVGQKRNFLDREVSALATHPSASFFGSLLLWVCGY